ncbi:MAG: Ig-like domain-containing protein, partial [Lachnospiraceae bacterium]|nr:Ig-like domain-containing protein [Lachnospiraceae bacterium]
MRHIKLLASLMSLAIAVGSCQPVKAENLESSKEIKSENYESSENQDYSEDTDNSYSINCMDLSVSEDELIETAVSENITLSDNSESSGFARSGMLKYDDINDQLSISDKKIEMDLGEVRKIDFTKTDSRISWESSRPDIVQVDVNGYLVAIKSGKSKITGYYNGKKYKINVRVRKNKNAGALNTIEVYTKAGKKIAFPKINKIKRSELKLSSNDLSVIRIDSTKNKIEAVGSGRAIVKYSYDYSDKKGNHKGSGYVSYYVEEPNTEDTTIDLKVGETKKLKLNGTYGGKLKWKSSNKKTAFVDELGVVTGLKNGTAVIKLNTGGKKYTYRVNVSGKADFYNASEDKENYASLRQNRFVTIHFLSSGKFTIEQ